MMASGKETDNALWNFTKVSTICVITPSHEAYRGRKSKRHKDPGTISVINVTSISNRSIILMKKYVIKNQLSNVWKTGVMLLIYFMKD